MLRSKIVPRETVLVKFKPTINVYGYFLNDEKRREFGKIGTRNMVDEIQDALEGCDYRQIMDMLIGSGPSFDDFGDVLNIAERITDVNDALAYSELLPDLFAELPLEVREHYGKDYGQFAADIIGGGFANFIREKYVVDESAESAADRSDANSAGVQSTDGGPGRIEQLQAEIDRLRKSGSGVEKSVDKGEQK